MNIIGTNHPRLKDDATQSKKTGAYIYGKEIEENILSQMPDIDVNVITAGASLHRPESMGMQKSAILCHDNRDTLRSYVLWLKKDMLWICSKHSTVETLRNAGELAVYIPLSIDTAYVAQYRTKKTKDIAFVGNAWGFKKEYLASLPDNIDQLSGLEREDLLKEMAKYKRVIAEGRCLMEAQVLGCDTEVPEYPNGLEAVYVEALDNRDTIKYWRQALTIFANAKK